MHVPHHGVRVCIHGDHGVTVYDLSGFRIRPVIPQTCKCPGRAVCPLKAPPDVFACRATPVGLIKISGRYQASLAASPRAFERRRLGAHAFRPAIIGTDRLAIPANGHPSRIAIGNERPLADDCLAGYNIRPCLLGTNGWPISHVWHGYVEVAAEVCRARGAVAVAHGFTLTSLGNSYCPSNNRTGVFIVGRGPWTNGLVIYLEVSLFGEKSGTILAAADLSNALDTADRSKKVTITPACFKQKAQIALTGRLSFMDQTLEDLTRVLDTQGLQAGLKWLNSRVPHRWTAIYRLDNLLMRNTVIIDKQGESEPGELAVVPLQESFCQFTMNDGQFLSHNTGEDTNPRLNGHRYKGVLNSYVGLPLMLHPDIMYGTLCHFDPSPLPIENNEFEFLQRVARILPPYLRHHTG